MNPELQEERIKECAKRIASHYTEKQLRQYLYDYDETILLIKKRGVNLNNQRRLMDLLNLRLITATALNLKGRTFRANFHSLIDKVEEDKDIEH